MSIIVNMILMSIVCHAKVTMLLPLLLSRYPAGRRHGVMIPGNLLIIDQVIPNQQIS